MKHLSSYPSIYAIGHRMIANLFDGPVTIEEKVDGSQFSFGVIDDELCCRSKGKDIVIDAPEKLFGLAIQTAKELAEQLVPGWIYRGEYLAKPKHNSLGYSRVPNKHIILFDVMTGAECYLTPEEKALEAERIGLECVPVVYSGVMTELAELNKLLERESILGGCSIEGVVVKNYNQFTQEKKIAIGKYVSEAFKEVHRKEWKQSNPTQTDVVQQIISTYKTAPRWEKAVYHLRDAGQLSDSPKDIGPLMKEVQVDVLKECEEEIKAMLFKHFYPDIKRGVVNGLPEWYKQRLAATAFHE